MNPLTADRSSPDVLSARPKRPLLSVIMPARNEELNLPQAFAEVSEVLDRLDCDYEVIVIDNASTDRTGELAAGFCQRNPRWRYLRFSRNFQVEGSIAAGYQFAKGDAAIVLYSDLQDPPELIPEFVRLWQQGNDIVYGVVRKRTGDTWWKALGARCVYRAVNLLADVYIPPNATEFRLLSRRAIDALSGLEERNRYTRGLSHWIGFRQCPLVYDRRPRQHGASKASLFLMATLAVNSITNFSIRPLQFFSMCGVFTLLATVVLGCIYLSMFLFGRTISGLTTVYLLLLANLAVMFLGVGVLGEYIGRIYIETKRRPFFLVEEAVNLDLERAATTEKERLAA